MKMKPIAGKVGLNINGDLNDREIVTRAVTAEKAEVTIWVGELDCLDPFATAELIADHVSVPVAVFCSPYRSGCDEIKSKLKRLKKFSNEILVTLIPGKSSKISRVIECAEKLKNELDIPVFVGCSGKNITRCASRIADGVIFNYAHSVHIGWMKKYLENDVFTACYAPSLVLPSNHYNELILAAAIIAGSSKIPGEFKPISQSKIDFEYIMRNRGSLELEEDIAIHSNYLRKFFTASGSVEDIAFRIIELLHLCDHVIMGSPFFRDSKSVDNLEKIVKIVERVVK